MSDETAAVNPDLFDDVSAGGGGEDFWPATTGVKRLQLTGFSAGPVFKNKKKVKNPDTGEEEEIEVDAPQVRWSFDVYTLAGERVTFQPEKGPNAGTDVEATTDVLTSTIISPKSKAGGFFGTLLRREIDFTTEKKGDLMAEAVGKWCLGTFKKNDNGKVRLSDLTEFEED